MNEHTPTIQYESDGLAENTQPYLTVKKARGYYEYAERAGTDSIFFILHDANSDKPFALINEAKPPLDERLQDIAMVTTAFGGSMDSTNSPAEITRAEVLEETGYNVPEESVLFLGSTLVSSQMSQIAHGFVVDVTGIPKTALAEHEQQDASEKFIHNSIIWMTANEIMSNNDWKSIFILAKLLTGEET